MTALLTIATRANRIRIVGLVRRAFDIVLAGVSLLALAPLLAMIAAAIFAESGGPIFFSHRRMGLNGRRFNMHKFRKFHNTCSANGLQLTLENDARLTRVGGVLRATKLDELPQLWNVLVGDMSVIGPRPESVGYAECFKDGFEQLLIHKPGILGPSQVHFRDEGALFPGDGDVEQFYCDVLFPMKARIDLEYYSRRSLTKDLHWLIEGLLATLRLKKHACPLDGNWFPDVSPVNGQFAIEPRGRHAAGAKIHCQPRPGEQQSGP